MTERVFDEAELVLRRSTSGELLRAFASLTHQMHGLHRVDAADLRAQRDRVEAEILRRMP